MSPQSDFRDARWRKLRDAQALDEPLDAHDEEFLSSYEPRGAAEQAEAELMGALVGLADGDSKRPGGIADDAALLDRVVEGYCNEAPRALTAESSDASNTKPGRRGWIVAVIGLGVTAAAALVAVALGATTPTPRTHAPMLAGIPEPAWAPPEAPRPSEEGPSDQRSGFVLASGGLQAAAPSGARKPASGALRHGTYHVGDEETCIAYDTATTCLGPGATVRISNTGVDVLELVDGDATVTLEAPTQRVFTVVVAGARYEAREPTVTHLSFARKTRAASVSVERGSISRVDGARRTAMTAARARPKAKIPDAKALLQQARIKRATGDTAGATKAYAMLLEHYPKAPASAPSMVTLAELYLSQGQAKRALKWFDRYSKRGGSLDEEARYGAIRALKKLGRRGEASKRADEFRRRYPNSGYASKLP
ncbi:MAG: tetratricopeptide repeat protein [Nannocystales bacterium]